MVRALTIACVIVLAACKPAEAPTDFTPAGPEAQQTIRQGIRVPTELPASRRALRGSGGRCNIERVDSQAFGATPLAVSKSKPVRFVGWFADTEKGAVPTQVGLRLRADDGEWEISVAPGSPRADVQRVLGGAAMFANTGYATRVDLAALPIGTYRVFTAFLRDSGTFACDNGRILRVDP